MWGAFSFPYCLLYAPYLAPRISSAKSKVVDFWKLSGILAALTLAL